MLVWLYKKIKKGKNTRYQVAQALASFISEHEKKERFITEFSKKFVEKAEQLVAKAKLKAIAKKELTNSDFSDVLAKILTRQIYQKKSSLTPFLVALMLYVPDELLSQDEELIEFDADEHLKNSDSVCIDYADVIKLNGWKIRIKSLRRTPIFPFYCRYNLVGIRFNRKNKSAVVLFTRLNYRYVVYYSNNKTKKKEKDINLSKIEITKNSIRLYFDVFIFRYHRRFGITKREYLAVFEILVKDNEIKLKHNGRE
ncbi:MAG: hypothetical protein ACP5H3_03015 [Candidatus Aenigmatarchaeota archaeon]